MNLARTDLNWVPHPLPGVAEKMLRVVKKWEGTPYMAGQCMPGVGVDCIRFGHAVLCEMTGKNLGAFPRLPQDMSMHNRLGSMRVLHQMRRDFSEHERVSGTVCIPMDIVITGYFGAGPGHMRLVGPEPNTIWEVTSHGVAKTGFAFHPKTQHVFRVYRLLGQDQWST